MKQQHSIHSGECGITYSNKVKEIHIMKLNKYWEDSVKLEIYEAVRNRGPCYSDNLDKTTNYIINIIKGQIEGGEHNVRR